MGLAKAAAAAQKNRQRQSMPAFMRSSSQATPTSSPGSIKDDSGDIRPGKCLRYACLPFHVWRGICILINYSPPFTGILRDPLTPRPRSRVSFAEKPIVFILKSPSKPLTSPAASPLKEPQVVLPSIIPSSEPEEQEPLTTTPLASEAESVLDSQSTTAGSQDVSGISFSPVVPMPPEPETPS